MSFSILSLPKHISLTIEHNPHKLNYETVEAWAERTDPFWETPSARASSIASDEVWVIQWYPITPIGFYPVAAPTLAEALRLACSFEEDGGSR